MTIKREINGVMTEIELTQGEMLDAYHAVDFDYWMHRLKDRLSFWSDEFPMKLSDEELRELTEEMVEWIREDGEVYDKENDVIWDCIVEYLKEKGRLE